MQPITAKIGQLVCHTFGDPTHCKALLVLCHGFGAPGTDLVGLGPELMQLDERLHDDVAIVFPEAPIDLGAPYGGGRAWWNIEVGRFASATTPEDLLKLAGEEPLGLKSSRRLLQAMLEELLVRSGLPMAKVVLGGFSQGSMLVTDLTLRAEEAPAALCIYSGALIAKDQWAAHAPRRKGLKVIQTHGRQDMVLPFFVGEALRDMLTEAGLELTFTAFDGPHTISAEGIQQLAEVTAAVVGGAG